MLERKASGIGYITGQWPLDREKPTLVFIHGAGSTGYFWRPQVEALAERANFIAVDLPGHGRSEGSGFNTVSEHANAVDRLVDDIEAPNPILCGFSLGGAIALQLLIDFPEKYQAGILLGTGIQMKVGPIIFETIEKDYTEFVDLIVKLAASKKTDPALVRLFRDQMADSAPEVVSGDFKACDRFDATAGAASIRAPVLVITSEEDILTPPKFGDVLEENIPNTQRIHLTGAGHLMSLEKPDEVNVAISEFFDKIGL